MTKSVIILSNYADSNSSADDQDVLVQVEMVEKALSELGFSVKKKMIKTSFEEILAEIEEESPDFVFNLVETFMGSGAYLYIPPAMLEIKKIPFTGGSSESLFITTNKIVTKKLLESANLPTPAWFKSRSEHNFLPNTNYIVKATAEDASIGIDKNSIIFANNYNDLECLIAKKEAQHKFEFFAEKYIEGREFNIALLDTGEKPEVLPAAEIQFIDFGDRFKIVDYSAKWDEDSFEYKNTVRNQNFGEKDLPLLEKLGQISTKCWEIFKLSGYARVDFRIDEDGNPWILEINQNPCISPDSGFMAAATKAGLDYKEVVRKIVENIRR